MHDTSHERALPAVPGRVPELLAPAGDEAAFEAAVQAGADAVYLGMTDLNARRRAGNFRPEAFGQAVQQAHRRGVRVYLTLNTDITERELPQAVRLLEVAREAGVDGVLVRDPALLALRAQYPQIEFHFSTQTCIANSADVAAAGELGAQRVVLARELTLAEIAAASAVEGVQTEVFVQGALCFCVSGRCLLSSWVGGRSGNRGACTSPCRVPWTVNQQPAGTPLSMHDLTTAHRLDDLRNAGVAALKIEGRLKTADWVRQAVTLYRRALAGETVAGLEPAAPLASYTGRQLTDGYLDGRRDQLTGLAEGRRAAGQAAPGVPRTAESGERDDAGDSQATINWRSSQAAAKSRSAASAASRRSSGRFPRPSSNGLIKPSRSARCCSTWKCSRCADTG
jgi:U32 family peptidase